MPGRSWFVAAALLLASGSAWAEKCPNMLIVLDRSWSMNGQKWAAANEAVTAFTQDRQSVMRYGLMVFPAPGEECGSGLLLDTCDFYNGTAISQSLALQSPGGHTPTGDTLASAAQLAAMNDTSRRRFIILVTDGDPTCPVLDAIPTDLDYAVSVATGLEQHGIKTFVIGFGQEVTPANLDRLADAGGTARVAGTCNDPANPGTRIPCKYYEASDSASLSAAFNEIANIAQGELQGATCDDSCYGIGGCPDGERCVSDLHVFGGGKYTLNLGKCVADPCAGVGCGADQFCREGQCVDACATPCSAGQVCRDGQCIADPCTANPASCTCGQGCTKYLVCVDGKCADDPCRYVKCPSSAPYCNLGSCYAASKPTGTPPGTTPPATSGSSPQSQAGATNPNANTGCACGAAGSPLALLALAAPALALLRRRRGQGPKEER